MAGGKEMKQCHHCSQGDDTTVLLETPATIYHQDRIWLYEVCHDEPEYICLQCLLIDVITR